MIQSIYGTQETQQQYDPVKKYAKDMKNVQKGKCEQPTPTYENAQDHQPSGKSKRKPQEDISLVLECFFDF